MTDPGRIEDFYALSPMQRGMLYHNLAGDGPEVYIVQLSCRLVGLDPARWKAAWGRVVGSNPALRTAFAWKVPERPVQLVGRAVTLPWAEIDLRSASEAEAGRYLDALLLEDRSRGYDLARAPLMRFTLLDLGDGRHGFVWSFHHILLDAWSGAAVLGEVIRLHDTPEGSLDGPGPAGTPFRPYVEWLGRQDRVRAEAYWRRTLRGYTSPTPLPLPPARRHGPSAWNFREEIEELPNDLTAKVGEFLRRHKLTLSTLIQGLWALVLMRYTGRDDVTFGTTVASRPAELPGVETAIGLYLNTLPTRVTLNGETTLCRWLSRLQDSLAEGRLYDYSGLTEIHGWSELPRDRPLFQTLLIFENLPSTLALDRGGRGLRVESARSHWFTSYPISLMIVPGDRLRLHLVYDEYQLADAGCRRLLIALSGLIRAALRSPDAPPGDLPIPTSDVPGSPPWVNGPSEPGYADRPVHALIAGQAKRDGGRVAIRHRGRAMSYAEFEARAADLAAVLAGLGIGAGDTVALALPRCPALIVALTAVLRIGAAFLPLDPEHPRARLDDILGQSGAVAMIVGEGAEPPRPTSVRAVLRLEPGGRPVAPDNNPRAEPTAEPGPDDLAYMIYTSGSTGRPKGVEVTHGALANLLRAVVARCGLRADDRLLAVTTPSFDIALLELLLPLTVGASIGLVGDDEATDPAALMAHLADPAVTVMQATPTLWRTLLDAGWPGEPGRLRIWSGGEALAPELAGRLLAAGLEVWNLYGPTETTIWSGASRVADPSAIGLGEPLANTTFLLLDTRGRPAASGAMAELWIGGRGVARGYRGRPDLTRERFRDLPGTPGGRSFRTGDLARRRADGSLEFLGRADFQVKVRGVRVEPSEVEAALSSHPGVREAGVAPHPGPGGETELTAFIVPGAGGPIDPGELAGYLQGRLPGAMHPSRVVAVDALPRLPNGKLDREALVRSAGSLAAGPKCLARPRGPMAELLARIWADLLGREDVPTDVSFWDLGGHSLWLIRLIVRVGQKLGLSLTLPEALAAPTVEAMAQLLEAKRPAAPPAPEEPPPDTEDGPAPLAHDQEMLFQLSRLEVEFRPYHLPVALRLDGPLDPDALDDALAEVIRRHEILRTRIVRRGGGEAQSVEPPRACRFERVDLGEDAPLEGAIAERMAEPLDLREGAPFRPYLFHLGPDRHALLIVVHHAIADGWSLSVLARDLLASYESASRGLPMPPARDRLRFSDYARRERRRWGGSHRETVLNYWRGRLDGLEPLGLPSRRPRAPVARHAGGNHHLLLPGPLAFDLARLARDEGATTFLVLAAALRCLLAAVTGREDIAFGTIVANRNRPDLDDLVGPVATTLVLRSPIPAGATFRAFLRSEREAFLDAHAQAIPLGLLLTELRPRTPPGVSPLVQVLFVLQNTEPAPREAGGLAIRPMVIEHPAAEVDLVLEVYPGPSGLVARFGYDRDLFERAQVKSWAEHYAAILRTVVGDPDTPSTRMTAIGPDVARRLIGEFNEPLEGAPARPFGPRAAREGRP